MDDWIRPYKGKDATRIPVFPSPRPDWRVGARRVRVSGYRDRTGLNQYAYAEFHTDGSGFFARQVQDPDATVEERNSLTIFDSTVTEYSTHGIRLLADHAITNAGCHGDALVSVSVIPPKTVENIRLIAFSNMGKQSWKPLDPVPSPDASVASINLDEVLGDWRGTLVAASLALADFMQACGIPQCRQISEDGELLPQAWPEEGLQDWAQRTGLTFGNPRD